MKQNQNIIDNLSCGYSVGKLSQDIGTDINKLIISFFEGTTVKVRLLGKYISGKRIFLNPKLNFSKYISPQELTKILKGDQAVANPVMKRICSQVPDHLKKTSRVESVNDIKNGTAEGKTFQDILRFIECSCVISSQFAFPSISWQSIYLFNALVLSSSTFNSNDISLLALTNSMVNDMTNKLDSKELLSGLYAHDLSITKKGNGLSSKYTVEFSNESSHLSEPMLHNIIGNGLWDIKKVVKSLNQHVVRKMGGFIYRLDDDYKMPAEIMGNIVEEYDAYQNKEQFIELDKHISDLPKNIVSINLYENSIESLSI